MAKRAMQRTFRNRAGLPWWYWRRLANRLARVSGGGASWILANGSWNDSAFWDDASAWKDN